MKKRIVLISLLSLTLLVGSIAPALAAFITDPIPKPSIERGKYTTDLFTGSATYNYPVSVPKGTNDLTPDVSLSYSSSGVRDFTSYSGSGWQLNQDYVQRDANYSPNDTSDDKYKLHFKGGTYDLVYNPVDSLFHTKIESHLRIQQFLSGGTNTTGMYWQRELEQRLR